MNIIDLLAILPYYIELIVDGNASALAVIRVVRLLRIFRVFKVGKYSKNLKILVKTFAASLDGLYLLAFLVGLGLVLFSTALFYAEQVGQTFDPVNQVWIRDDGSESPFQSIIHTFWWCIVTMTTVGYGDMFPVTWLGKIIAGITMLTGVLVLAFPISVLGANFNDQWSEAQKHAKRRRQMRLLKKKGLVPADRPLRDVVKEISKLHHDLGDILRNMQNQLRESKDVYNELTQQVHRIDQKLYLQLTGCYAERKQGSQKVD